MFIPLQAGRPCRPCWFAPVRPSVLCPCVPSWPSVRPDIRPDIRPLSVPSRTNTQTATSQTKQMTMLMILCQFSDQGPNGTEADVMNTVYSGNTMSAMVQNASYGRISMPRAAGKAVTVQMGRTWQSMDGCVWESIASLAREKIKQQHPSVNLNSFQFHEFFLPKEELSSCVQASMAEHGDKRNMQWGGLAHVGCGHYSRMGANTGSTCTAWYRMNNNDAFVRGHELGHNLGLLHAGGQTRSGAWVEYGDPTASMGNSWTFSSYTAAGRFQMGVLQDRQGEAIEWQAGRTTPITLQALNLQLNQAGADAVGVRFNCPNCVPKVPNHAHKRGGQIWVQFRGDDGFS